MSYWSIPPDVLCECGLEWGCSRYVRYTGCVLRVFLLKWPTILPILPSFQWKIFNLILLVWTNKYHVAQLQYVYFLVKELFALKVVNFWGTWATNCGILFRTDSFRETELKPIVPLPLRGLGLKNIKMHQTRIHCNSGWSFNSRSL